MTNQGTMVNSHPDMAYFLLVLGFAFLLIMGLLCLVLLWKIAKNEIDLSTLLDEANGDASMSRFQLLIFTLVVAVGLFLYMLNNLTLPDIPNSILVLLGISATTYGAGKAISYSRDEGVTTESERDKNRTANVTVQTANAQAAAAAAPAQVANAALGAAVGGAVVQAAADEAAAGGPAAQ